MLNQQSVFPDEKEYNYYTCVGTVEPLWSEDTTKYGIVALLVCRKVDCDLSSINTNQLKVIMQYCPSLFTQFGFLSGTDFVNSSSFVSWGIFDVANDELRFDSRSVKNVSCVKSGFPPADSAKVEGSNSLFRGSMQCGNNLTVSAGYLTTVSVKSHGWGRFNINVKKRAADGQNNHLIVALPSGEWVCEGVSYTGSFSTTVTDSFHNYVFVQEY